MKLAATSRKVAACCVWHTGWDADAQAPEYVRRWADGIRRNTLIAAPDLHCFTDGEVNVEGVATHPLPVDLPRWHSKFGVFKAPELAAYDQAFYFDLDTMITGNMDGWFSVDTGFAMVKDPFHPKTMNSSLMTWKPGEMAWLADKAVKENPPPGTGDQGLIESWVRGNGSTVADFSENFVVWDLKNDLYKNPHLLPGPVTMFHGHPRPHEIDWMLPTKKERRRRRLLEPRVLAVPKVKRLEAVKPNGEMKGKTVWIIGGGPSIKGVDLDTYLMDECVLAINDAYGFKCAEHMFFGDPSWWAVHGDRLASWPGTIWTSSSVSADNVRRVRSVGTGLPARRGMIGWNANSGFAGLSLALQCGATKIYLVGFDMAFGADGESNWHPNIKEVKDCAYTRMLAHETKMAKDFTRHWADSVEVWNTNPDSRMCLFPKCELMPLLERREVVSP